MIFGNCIIELKLVEKLRLFALQPSHHGLPPPRFVSARWNHGSPQASTTSATKSARAGHAGAVQSHLLSSERHHDLPALDQFGTREGGWPNCLFARRQAATITF